jgi:alkylation response protein AidB-like acyl-CoA dehydrogenase
MDFDLTDEQRLLKDSVDRLIADRYDFEARKKFQREPDGFSAEIWKQYAELGLLGLPFTESQGGFGGGPVETMLVMEAFGRGLILEPYLATIVLGGGLLRRAASEAQQAALIPGIVDGTLKLAFAHIERHSRYDLGDVATTAKRDGDGWLLSGAKSVVLHGDCADRLIVTARTGGSQRDRGGIGLFLVEAGAEGVARRGYPTQDGLRAAEITLSGARAEALGDPAGGLPIAEHVVDETIAALCAEAVGAMASMLANETNPLERARAMSAAKVQIGRSGKLVGQEAIQLHGGIGMTQEYKVGHYFKRTTMIDMLFGDADAHLTRLAAMGGLFGLSQAA